MIKNIKMLLITLSLTILGIVLCTNVQATTTTTTMTEEKAQQMLDMLPDSIEIDLKEIENIDNQAETLVKEQVYDIWAKNGIDMEEVKELENQYNIRVFNVGIDGAYQYSSIKDFYEARIWIDYNNNSDDRKEKKINIIYSNHKDYNKKDEQYIKNFKIENKIYFETDLKFAYLNKYEERLNEFLNVVNKYYESLFNDKSITIRTSLGAGDGSELNEFMGIPNGSGGCAIMIFKNDILYDLRYIGTPTSIPVITVPYNIDDAEICNYALELIKTTFGTNYDTSKLSIRKGISESQEENYLGIDKNIPNIYTVYDNAKGSNYPFGWLIIRKEGVTDTDEKTNVQFSASNDVVPNNTVLDVKEVSDETTLNQIRVSLQDTSTKYVTYDITLKSNNVAIQPNGKVQISIPIPKDFNKNNLAVYRIEPNGDKIAYEITIKTIDGQDYAVFETNHFSNYVLAEKTLEGSTSNNKQEQEKQQEQNKQHILDDEPKTGTTSNVSLIAIMVVITISIIFLYKKYK